MSVETVTLGCRLNFAESETIARSAPAGEDWVVVNSCAVTNEAVRQTRQAIRRAHRRRPDARILVTGCAADLDPSSFEQMPGVGRVVGNEAKLRAFATDGMTSVPAGLMHKVKSFVAVQTGCDHRCTFCSIWQARGASRSLPFEAIRDAVARELDRGAKEIVLTGVDITDYADGLGRLCQRLLNEPRLHRLRLSSLDSIEIDDALFELIAGEPRLMPHFHLSLQAGDDMILKRMKRRHSRADAVRTVERIKAARPDATIGADLIAGFPTETEEMALNSLKMLDDCDVISAHVFPFSARPGTPAARMPQVSSEGVKARAARLRHAAAELRARWLDSLVGTIQPILIEGDGTGHTDSFAPVTVTGAQRGQTGKVSISARNGDKLVGAWA
jgi:threonylcarbamoyladenosine tRNA methylthiotransferase MtaB